MKRIVNESHPLFVSPFSEADQLKLAGFCCGDTIDGRYCTQWICGSDCLDSINRHGTKVWLYRDSTGGVVGYGSLGKTRWRWPPPDGDYTNLLMIPMLGIDQRFHGQPPGNPAQRYSHRIVEHLISEAEIWNASLPKSVNVVTLTVRESNERAQRLYRALDFAFIEGERRRNDFLVMARRLLRPKA